MARKTQQKKQGIGKAKIINMSKISIPCQKNKK